MAGSRIRIVISSGARIFMHEGLKALMNTTLSIFGYQIQRIHPDNPNPIHLWDEKYFNDLMKQIEQHTLVDKVRCFMIYQLAKQASMLQGDVAEVGVYKGGTARLLSKAVETREKTLHLFDTFSGMPSTNIDKDLHKEGDFDDTTIGMVKAYLGDCKNIRFYQGVFPSTAEDVKNITFCLVHIDVDIYRSVIDCCIFFYIRMQKGGIMIFDDYGFLTCPGAKVAVDEFFADKPEYPCYLPTGQCIVIRQ